MKKKKPSIPLVIERNVFPLVLLSLVVVGSITERQSCASSWGLREGLINLLKGSSELFWAWADSKDGA
jgi:hypothetical protein